MPSRMMKLAFWWENATNGQEQFGTLSALSKKTGIRVKDLEDKLQEGYSTPKEWWNLIGKPIYKTQREFARFVTMMVAASVQMDKPIARSTMTEWLNGKSLPLHREDMNAMYALTCLPCFLNENLEDDDPTVLTKRARFIRDKGTDLIQEIDKILGSGNTTDHEKSGLLGVMKKLAAELRERIDNIEIVQRLNDTFGG